jgi:TolB-like protein
MVFLLVAIGLADLPLSLAYEKEIKGLSADMAEHMSEAGKRTIAVVDFADLQGNITELGRFIAEEFSVALAGANKGFEVVDRTHLKVLAQEHKLSMTGLIHPETAKKIGQIAGVDALVMGTITPFLDTVRISAKILDTSTAKLIGGSSCNIEKTKAIEGLLVSAIETARPSELAKPGEPLTPKPQSKAERRVVVNKVTFEVIKCERSEGSVICDMMVTNDDIDKVIRTCRKFHRSGKAYLYSKVQDNLRKKALCRKIQVLEKQLEEEGCVSVRLYRGERVTVRYIFNDVTPEASGLSSLNLAVDDSRGGDYINRVKFRNIPFSK